LRYLSARKEENKWLKFVNFTKFYSSISVMYEKPPGLLVRSYTTYILVFSINKY
jgi:hypothetical protein